MGLLRSALSAASRVARGPAQALEVVDLYARSVEGAENTTVVTTRIDWDTRTITYSSAGHPPPALLHTDGAVEFLDQATAPRWAPTRTSFPGPRPPPSSPPGRPSFCTPTA